MLDFGFKLKKFDILNNKVDTEFSEKRVIVIFSDDIDDLHTKLKNKMTPESVDFLKELYGNMIRDNVTNGQCVECGSDINIIFLAPNVPEYVYYHEIGHTIHYGNKEGVHWEDIKHRKKIEMFADLYSVVSLIAKGMREEVNILLDRRTCISKDTGYWNGPGILRAIDYCEKEPIEDSLDDIFNRTVEVYQDHFKNFQIFNPYYWKMRKIEKRFINDIRKTLQAKADSPSDVVD